MTPIRHLYIHIPFCPAKCSYCAFVTHVGSLRLMEAYLDAVRTEIKRHADHPRAGRLETIYFGGGTPSMMSPEQLRKVLQTVQEAFGVDGDAEITIEAHPETVDMAKLQGFRESGANRISFGIESLNPAELRALGRSYEPERALQAIRGARQAGYGSVALDLMYALPSGAPDRHGRSHASSEAAGGSMQTIDSWEATLKQAIDSGVDHLSLYPLQIEPRTVFGRRAREGRLAVPDDERAVEMYELACTMLARAGLEHYEFSNWARPGHQCRHNRAYWLNQEFFAAGVGAHGYIKPWRTENMRGVRRYIEVINRGDSTVVRIEPVDRDVEERERKMLALRLLEEGVAFESIDRCRKPGRTPVEHVRELERHGHLRVVAGRVVIPERAVPIANEIIERVL